MKIPCGIIMGILNAVFSIYREKSKNSKMAESMEEYASFVKYDPAKEDQTSIIQIKRGIGYESFADICVDSIPFVSSLLCLYLFGIKSFMAYALCFVIMKKIIQYKNNTSPGQ